MNQQTKIAIKGLNFYYQDKKVIQDLNLSIPVNEILAVFGPANSGITTLLRSLNRLCDLIPGAHSEGEILLDGKNINAPNVSVTDLRRRIGMVFDVPISISSVFKSSICSTNLVRISQTSLYIILSALTRRSFNIS